MEDITIEKQIEDTTMYLADSDVITKQIEGIMQIKRSKALKSIGLAVVFIVLGALLSFYGVADVFTDKKLPMGVLFLIGGPILFVISMGTIISHSARAASASQVNFATDLEDLCRTFYTNAFCKKTTDIESKDDQIVDLCQFFLLRVLQHYNKSEWDPKKAQPVKGWNALAERWMNLRYVITKEDINFTLSSITIDKTPRSDQRIVDVIITLKGTPFGRISFYNVAINIEGKWFIASPEPIRNKPKIFENKIKNESSEKEVEIDEMTASVSTLIPDPNTGRNNEDLITRKIEPYWMPNQVPVTNNQLDYDIGLETMGNVFIPLIHEGEPIPCEHKEKFTTGSNNQTELDLHVLYGSSDQTNLNTSLGKFKITGIPKAPRGVLLIEVTFIVKPTSEFVLLARDQESGRDLNVIHI
jgi:hypothetical protein